MKVRTLIAGAAVMLLCGGLGVCVAQEATPAAPAAEKAAPSSAAAPKAKHHRMRRHHHGKQHAQKEYTEQELQQMSASPPSK
jgi:hypothetical protein